MGLGNEGGPLGAAIAMKVIMEDSVIEAAVAWHAGQMHDDFDWDGFTLWLEADPRHRLAFDEIASLDDAVEQYRDRIAPLLAGDEVEQPQAAAARRSVRWRGWAGGAIAAALVAAVALPVVLRDAAIDYHTATGETRVIALANGVHVQLASGSHLTVADRKAQEIKLAGAAWFDVSHDPARTLTIRAGPYRITDIGTKFDVSTATGGVKVAVAKGSLWVSEGGLVAPVQLKEGQHLLASPAIGVAEVSAVAPENVASWRKGRLIYQDVPLSLVAAEVSRYAGHKVVADPAVAARRFSGVLPIGDGSALVSNLAQFANLRAIPEGSGVRLADSGSR